MTRPLWIDPDEHRYPSLEGNLEVDVLIVGGGLSGIGAAWALRDTGAAVAIVEERSLAAGASGRNGGFVLAGPAASFGNVAETIGDELAVQIWHFTLANNRLMGAIVDDNDIDCHYLRRGSMGLAISADELEELRRTHEHLGRAGIQSCLVKAEELPRPFDALYAGGLYFSGNAELNPGLFVRGVAGILPHAIRVYEHTPVLGLESGERWVARTPNGVARARAVLLCTNAYTARLLPGLPIAPRRGQVMATSRLDRVVVPFPMHANRGYQYWRQTPEGRLVVGGWRDMDLEGEVGMDEVLHGRIQDALDGFAVRIAGAVARPEYRWAGIMGFTPDLFPFVGPMLGTSGLYVCAGFSGHGVAMAFMCGGAVALGAIGREVELPASFRPDRPL